MTVLVLLLLGDIVGAPALAQDRDAHALPSDPSERSENLVSGEEATQGTAAPKLEQTDANLVTRAMAELKGVSQSATSIADVNGDDNPDLLVTGTDANEEPIATLYFGKGDGTFTEAKASLTEVRRSANAIADMNGDGNQDLVVTGEDADENRVATLYLGNGDGTFSEANAGLSGMYWGSISIADVNGDGASDLLLTGLNADSDAVATLYLGNGDGTFSEANAGLAGVYESSTSIADVNNDDNPDLLISGTDENTDPSTTLYLGKSDGSFEEAGAGLVDVESSATSMADVNDDGNQDLLITGTTGFSTYSRLYLSNGDGTFDQANAGLTGLENGSTSIEDIDQDGNKDLLLTGSDGTISDDQTAVLYLGDGNGGFTKADAGLTGVESSAASIGDLDGDGDSDLLIAGFDYFKVPSARIYINRTLQSSPNRAPRFARRLNDDPLAAGLSRTQTLEAGDPDGDPISIQATTGGVTVEDAGNGVASVTFSPDRSLLGQAIHIEVSDSDGATSSLWVDVPERVASLSAGLKGIWEGTSSMADVNADGHQDVLVAGDSAFGKPSTTLYLGAGDGTFSVANADLTGVENSATSIGDVNGDDNPDLLITGSTDSQGRASTLYLGNGDGTFSESSADFIDVNNGATSTADVNGDDHQDLLIAGDQGNFSGEESTVLYLGNGDGTFSEAGAGLVGISDGSTSIADVNGDTYQDILIAGTSIVGDETATLYLGNGDGTFEEAGAGLTGVRNASTSIADVDGDGRKDILITGAEEALGETGSATLYLGDGNGSFSEANAGLKGVEFGSSTISDVNGDGHPDLLIAGEDASNTLTTTLYLGRGDGTFSAAHAGLQGVRSGGVSTADVDGDADPDLLVTGLNGSPTATLYENLSAWSGAVASSSKTVSSDGSVDFGSTGVDVVFSGVSGSGEVSVERYDDPPPNTDGITESDVVDHRFVVEAGGNLSFDASTEVRVNVGVLSDVSDPKDVALYKRSSAGSGTFEALDVSYDAGANELVATTGSFSEFALAVESDGGQQSAPSSLTAEAPDAPTPEIEWTPAEGSDLARYHIYRDTESITGTPSDHTPIDSVDAADSTYTDEAAELGQTYYYRVTAVDNNGSETDFSNEDSVFLYPQTVAADVNRSFGAASDSADYRLVALPGAAQEPLSDAINGEAGAQWQAYYDDGSESDYLQKFDGSEPFTFEGGNGFWLAHTGEWTVSQEFETVELQGDSAATIGLRDGWNVISNPIGKNVAWSDIEVANDGTIQALWAFDGSFVKADSFRSARSGEAYYFYNGSGLNSLLIPYPGSPADSKAAPKEETPLLALTAQTDGDEGASSTVRLGVGESSHALIAPPGRFEPVSLRIKRLPTDEASTETTEDASKRARFLMAEARSAEGDGETFQLRLTSRTEGPITLRASNVEAVKGRAVSLLTPASGQSYDLASEETVTINPQGSETELQVVLGTKAYVEGKKQNVLPQEVALTSYPNPVGQQGTLEYALPEETEVSLTVYDVLGRQVATLEQGRKKAGRHTVQIDTGRLSSGVYFGRLQAGDQTRTQKITVVR